MRLRKGHPNWNSIDKSEPFVRSWNSDLCHPTLSLRYTSCHGLQTLYR